MGLTCHMTSVNRVSEEHQIAMWGLAFYLLENLEEQTTETELAPAVLQYTLSPVMTQGPPSRLRLALLQGLERLVVSRSVGGKVREQVTKVAVEQLHQPNPRVFLPALQLLLSCMYTAFSHFHVLEFVLMGVGLFPGKCESVESSAEEGKETNPELLIQAMEKTSALFDRIKKGYPFEVELVCGVLPNLLTDFFPPSEILTRVIGEFLSTQQPHPRLMAAVVFQVFERACQLSQLGLLQHWVVLSLANFTQCMPVGMATWCLTCFFISASTNPWLRAMYPSIKHSPHKGLTTKLDKPIRFPHVQSRIGRCDYEDRRLLCVAALVFYNQLTDETQKQTFVSTFQSSAHQSQHLLADLRACL
ncbi:unnamed protein product [Timema podura]|uniref:Huntingtin n=1 Tax=Timema podura TaxID=61482 RepID=A0ABN7NUI1_TIMPD|nr:unnamed protein product [Timema podura]